jgi:molybdate transport system substrate-binding protein
MRMRRFLPAIALAVAAGIFALAQGIPAQAPPLRVLASNGVQGAVTEIIPECERAVGHPLAVQWGTTVSLKQKIESGEPFDFTILTSEAIDALIKEGKVTADSRANAARVGIGIGIRSGASKPDIGTAEALKSTLLHASSVTYAAAGASRVAIEKMLDRMGITDALKSKTLLLGGADETAAAVREGKAELLITLISEIKSAKGLELAGPLPQEFQAYTSFSAAVSSTAKERAAAKTAVKFLTGPKAAAAYKSKGMEPVS